MVSVCSFCKAEQTSYIQTKHNKEMIMKKSYEKINIRETIHHYIKEFMINCSDFYQDMQNCDHNETKVDCYSQWHIEGSVWTHTMMVLSQLTVYLDNTSRYHNEKLLILATLFHDIGKPKARFWNDKKQKIVFYGHSGISTMLANEFLEYIEPNLTKDEKLYILRLINYHQILFDAGDLSGKTLKKFSEKFKNSFILLDDLYALRYADFNGNLSTDKMNLSFSDIENIKRGFKKCLIN